MANLNSGEMVNQMQTNDRAVAGEFIEALKTNIGEAVTASERDVEVLICAAVAGSLLLESTPGTGKTLIAKTMARAIGGEYARVQGTPDVTPSDYTGTEVWLPNKSEYEFRSGPVLNANVILMDDFSRAPEKSQAGLIEAMEEHQVTVGGKTYKTKDPLFVIATQNPADAAEGTNGMTMANIDRFAASLKPGRTKEQELDILADYLKTGNQHSISQAGELDQFVATRRAARGIFVSKENQHLIQNTIAEVESNPRVDEGSMLHGRAMLRIADLARAHAMLRGKEVQTVIPEDIVFGAIYALAHRVVKTFDAVDEKLSGQDIVQEAIEGVKKGSESSTSK